MLETARTLTDQIYDALVDEICAGQLAPGSHLVQERLAERFGVSRQPIQQTMSRLKADGMVEEIGKRGLFVTRLDPDRMLEHYGVRAALDSWAARMATDRLSGDAALAKTFTDRGQQILIAARQAINDHDVSEQVRLDSAFHFLIYGATGNSLIATTAEPHWRFLRRAMGDVLRKAEAPDEIWRQHANILEAILTGDAACAANLAETHARSAAVLLADALLCPSTEEAS